MADPFRSGYPSGLVVSAVQVLLHHYWSPDPHPEIPQLGLIYQQLHEEGLIGESGRVTERGECFARSIMETPLPIQRWVMR